MLFLFVLCFGAEKKFTVTTARHRRLSFMGTVTSERYGSLENSTSREAAQPHLKTSAGSVEHNGVIDQEAGETLSRGPASAYMADNVLTQTERESGGDLSSAEGHEFDSFFGKAFEEKPIWKELYEQDHDIFFPPNLPPLVLTSKPIPVVDRMAVKTNPWAVGTSSFVNLAILAVAIWLGITIIHPVTKPKVDMTNVDVSDILKAPKKTAPAGGFCCVFL